MCTRRKASASKWKSTIFSWGRTQLNWLFSNPPPNPLHVLPVHDVIHIHWSTFLWDFYFDIYEGHILPVRALTPALMLHLSNPCTEPKESTVLGPPDFACLSRFLQPDQNFLIYQFTVLWPTVPSPFMQQMFLVASTALWPSLNT